MPAARATRTAPERAAKVRRAKFVRLAAAFVLMAVSGLVWSSFGLFLVALEARFGWSRAAISGTFGTFALVNALTAPLFGYALGRWDSRLLLAGASLVLGLALAGVAWVGDIGQFWLVFGVLGGLASHCTSSYAVFAVLAGRFRRRPATAMAIADAGSGLAAFAGLPLVHLVIVHHGWQAAFILIGAVVALVGGGLHLLVLDRVRRRPPHLSAGGLRAVPPLALLALAVSYFCGSAAYHGLLTQQIALFDERGVAEDMAVWIAALAGLVIFLWRLVSGWLCDRWGPAQVMMIAATGAALTFAILASALDETAHAALLLYPLALGIAFGGQQVLLAGSARLLVSLALLASVLGACRLAAGLGMAAGPVIAGYTRDVTGSYTLAVVLLGLLAIGHFVAFVAALRGRRQPVGAVLRGSAR